MNSFMKCLFLLLFFNLFNPQNVICKELEFPFREMNEKESSLKFVQMRNRRLHRISIREKSKIEFASVEYLLTIKALDEAKRTLLKHSKGEIVEISTFLASVFLYKMALTQNDHIEAELIKKELFNRKFILLFRKYKKILYKSLYNNEYEVHYFIDRIEIFLNGEILAEISS